MPRKRRMRAVRVSDLHPDALTWQLSSSEGNGAAAGRAFCSAQRLPRIRGTGSERALCFTFFTCFLSGSGRLHMAAIRGRQQPESACYIQGTALGIVRQVIM